MNVYVPKLHTYNFFKCLTMNYIIKKMQTEKKMKSFLYTAPVLSTQKAVLYKTTTTTTNKQSTTTINKQKNMYVMVKSKFYNKLSLPTKVT